MALCIIELCPACKITVLYVIDKLVLNELVRFSKRRESEVEAELEEQGRRYLELARKSAERQGVVAECQTRRGDPFEEVFAGPTTLAPT
jgi:nucleotide-binding universal stress UspA family protein